MLKRVALAVILVAGAHTVGAQQPGEAAKGFTGHWRLVSFVNFDDKGASRPSPFVGGRILYDAHGNMSAQLTHAARKPMSTPSTEAERAAAYAGYVSYFGRYTLDEAQRSVTHHVEGSTNPNWVNTTLVRYYEFSDDGNRLMLSVKNAAGRVTGTLTWERLR
jgi:hypothetical protein